VVGSGPERFADLPLAVRADLVPDAGAIGGVYTALAGAARDSVLVVACDLPFLHAGLLTHLVDLAAARDGAWIRTPNGVEPLLACYRRRAEGRIRARIDAGQMKLADLTDVLDMAEMNVAEVAQYGPPGRLLANLNTPDDYVQYVR